MKPTPVVSASTGRAHTQARLVHADTRGLGAACHWAKALSAIQVKWNLIRT
jgi:hypothetical protein